MGGKIVFSTNGADISRYPYRKKKMKQPKGHTMPPKISFKWMIGLIIKAKIIKFLKEKIEFHQI